MILKSLQYISNQLDAYFKNKFGLDERSVILNKIVDFDGSVPLENQNKVVISLIHLEQENTMPIYGMRKNESDYSKEASSISENVYFLIAPNFDAYEEGLKFLNASLNFFRQNSVFDSTTSVNLPENVYKLNVELVKGDNYSQMHNLWTSLGARYQASFICKLRLTGSEESLSQAIETPTIDQ